MISLAEPALIFAVPAINKLPESVIAQLVLRVNDPETVEAPRSKAPASTKITLLPLVMINVEKVLALFSVISLAEPTAMVVIPVTDKAPLSVKAPAVVMLNVPETVDTQIQSTHFV